MNIEVENEIIKILAEISDLISTNIRKKNENYKIEIIHDAETLEFFNKALEYFELSLEKYINDYKSEKLKIKIFKHFNKSKVEFLIRFNFIFSYYSSQSFDINTREYTSESFFHTINEFYNCMKAYYANEQEKKNNRLILDRSKMISSFLGI